MLKKIPIYFTILFIFSLFLSCNKNNDQNNLSWWKGNVETFTNVLYDSTLKKTSNKRLRSFSINEAISQPYLVSFGAHFLFFIEKTAAPFIRVFDLRKKEFITSFGIFGKGPGEFQSISSPSISCSNVLSSNLKSGTNSDCFLFVYDMFLQRVTKINIPTLLKNEEPEIITLNIKSEDGFIFGLIPTSPDTVVAANGLFLSSRLQFFDTRGKFLSKTGTVPTDGSEFPPQIRSQAYLSDIFFDEKMDRIFLINHNTDKIEIYSNDGTPKLLINGPDFFEPQYEVSTSGEVPMMGSAGDMRFSHIDLCFDKQHFYVLYSGLSRAQAHSQGRRSRTGNKILKFSYDGKLQHAKLLPIYASALACNSYNDNLILLENNLFPNVHLLKKNFFKPKQ